MRSKVTVVLLFLNVVLFCYIYYYDRPLLRDLDERKKSHQVLPTEIASMDSFTRTSRTGETVRMEKRGDGWWLTAPYEWPANPNAVSSVHNELQFLKNVTSFAVADLDKSGQTLADYGLADPAYTVEFTAAQKTFKFLIGDDTKTGNRLYVLSPDRSRIHVVGRSLAETVGLPLNNLRAESIYSIHVFEVRSLNIQTTTPANIKVRLRRDANSRWSFESPILARAAKTAVEQTINELNSLSAKSFLDPHDADLDRTGLNSPILRITLEGNARRETLLLGKPAPTAGDYYAKIEDKSVVFTTAVNPKLLEKLGSSQESLRDPRVVDFEPATVTSLTITAPGQPELSLQKLESAPPAAPAASSAPGAAATAVPATEGWQVVTRTAGQTPVTISGDATVIGNLLLKLQALSARETVTEKGIHYGFLSDAPSDADKEKWGFNRPEREITLNLSTGGGLSGRDPSTLVLQIGVSPDEPGKAFARLTNPTFVYEILPDIIEATPVTALHYRQRLLRKLPEGALITSLAVVDLATGKTIYAQKLAEGDKVWTAALAMEPEPIRKAVNGILKELGELRAQRFAAETFSTDHAETPAGPRPWRFRVDYTVAFNGSGGAQSTPASLLLTERFGGKTQLAGTADFGGVVFSITQELLDSLFPLTYTGDPGPPPPANAPVPTGTNTPAPTNPAPASTSPAEAKDTKP
ncbi:MAG TPA: DUF4340 domain-containing protein [Lacunisphaera sp.]|nr:DUF4340 domain-containing protein [Lacunisphaera sp.]